jgi:hypothetical protein
LKFITRRAASSPSTVQLSAGRDDRSQDGWYCTQSCEADGECPMEAGWRCHEFYPGARACIAPQNWMPRNALLPIELEAKQ